MPFILIGDSGQHDPDIYQEITESYPGRILAIYLRDVNRRKKMERVKNLYKNYTRVPVLLVDDTEAAINHAKDQGFI